jgi:hypothetical protein
MSAPPTFGTALQDLVFGNYNGTAWSENVRFRGDGGMLVTGGNIEMASGQSLLADAIADRTTTGSYMAMYPAGTLNGSLVVYTRAAGNVGLTVKATASQTGDLQQWQDSTGAVLARFKSNGSIYFGATTGEVGWYRVSNYNMGFSSGGNTPVSFNDTGMQFSSGTVIKAPIAAGGLKIGDASNQYFAFWGKTPIVQPASLGADATDLPTALTLLNNIKNNVLTPVGLAA